MSDTTKITYEPPSQTFSDLLCQMHATHADCNFCNRVHFADPNPESSCASDEILAFRVQATEQPEKYHRHELCDGIAFGEIDGRNFVYGCPCNTVSRYENFIWEHRKFILEYLGKRASIMMGEAMSLKAGVRQASTENPQA